MDKPIKKNAKFFIDSKGFCARVAMLLMALSALLRVIGCWGQRNDSTFATTQILLPVACCLLFIVCILLCGKRCFFLSCIPMICGVVFFIIKSFGFESIVHTMLCILLYISVAILYTATVFGAIRTKWIMAPLFVITFLYHIVIEDIPKIQNGGFTLFTGLQEISVLCIILALFFTTLGLKNNKPIEDMNLPKIKDPVVKPPQEESTTTDAAPAAEQGKTETTDAVPAAEQGKTETTEAVPSAEQSKTETTDAVPAAEQSNIETTDSEAPRFDTVDTAEK